MELRIEIGSNLRKVLEQAGNLNEKWDDVMGQIVAFIKDRDIVDLEISLNEYDGEGGKRRGSVTLSKQFAYKEPSIRDLVKKPVIVPLNAVGERSGSGAQVPMFPADKEAEPHTEGHGDG